MKTDVVAQLALLTSDGKEILGRRVPRYDRRERALTAEWEMPRDHCPGCACGLPYTVTSVGLVAEPAGPIVDVMPLTLRAQLLPGDKLTVAVPVG